MRQRDRGGDREQTSRNDATSPRKWWVGSLGLALVVLLAIPAAAGQASDDRVSWSLGAGAGIQEVASHDELGSPLVYAGVNAPMLLWLDARAQSWSAGARVDGVVSGVNGGPLTTRYAVQGAEGQRADTVFVDLSGWVQWAVATPGQLRVSVGPQLGHWTFFRSYNYHPSQIGSVETWDSTITADLRVQLDQKFERWGWSVAGSAAAAGRILRPAYAVRGDERLGLANRPWQVFTHGRWAAVGRLQMVQAEAVLQAQLTRRLGVVGRYRTGFLSHGGELTSRAFRQQLTAGVQLVF